MDDVAARAGVSRASVSRVMLGQKKVSAETIRRVRAAAAELGYVPNVMASQLASGGTSDTVGLLLRDAANPAYGLLFTELQRAAQAAGLALVSMTIDVDERGDRQLLALDHLIGMHVQGLIVATGGVPSEQLSPFRERLPIIRCGRPEPSALIHAVSYDEVGAGRTVAREVAAAGHRQVVVLQTPSEVSHPEWVRAGAVVDALAEAGVSTRVLPVRFPADQVGPALDLVVAGAATAVVCPSDVRLLELLREGRRRGLRAPDDFSATGFDGILPGLDLLGLTTVRLDVATVARLTIGHLRRLLAGDDALVRELVPGTFVRGTTLGAPTPTPTPTKEIP